MPKAKKLPSGSWRCRVYSYTDADGKKHQESFTAPTKAEAEMMAAEYASNKKRRVRHDLTVAEALQGYITAKEGVLSPSTIRGYERMRTHNFESIKDKKIKKLTSEDLQIFISDLSKDLSAKSIKNIYGLLTASIALYYPDARYRVTLPAKDRKRPESPSDATIRLLWNAATPSMRLYISLGLCGMRRGEICALKHEDITDGIALIHADMVQDKDGKWIYKDMPKNSDSIRTIKLPPTALELIGDGEGFIVHCKPETISKRFYDLRKKLNLDIHFHLLRHYYASSAAILSIPDTYLSDMGGWRRGSSVMKSVYQNNIASMADYYSDKLNDHIFGKLKEDVN